MIVQCISRAHCEFKGNQHLVDDAKALFEHEARRRGDRYLAVYDHRGVCIGGAVYPPNVGMPL